MNPEQKRLTERLLEVPRMRAGQMITLLTIWLEAETDNDTSNMIVTALTVAREIEQSLAEAAEGKV